MKKKGFTLIELLAVIVILAIIALIATPMIMGVIDDARKGAAEASANGYIEAVENSTIYTMLESGEDKGLASGVYVVKSETEGTKLPDTVKVKGEKPTEGWVAVGNDGVVVAACLKFDSYSKWVKYTADNHAEAILDKQATKPTNPTDSVTWTASE